MSKTGNLARALGAVTLNFSYLEMVLMYSIWVLIDISDCNIGKIATVGTPFSSLVPMFEALYRHRVINVIEEEGKKAQIKDIDKVLDLRITRLENLVKRINEANEKRNMIIHSVWAGSDQLLDDHQRIKFKLKKGLKQTNESMTVKDIANCAIFIAEVAREVENFSDHFHSPLFWLYHQQTWEKQWKEWIDSGDFERHAKLFDEYLNNKSE